MLISHSSKKGRKQMVPNRILPDLVQQIVIEAYPELKDRSINAKWGRTASFAVVTWTSSEKNIGITCHQKTKKWHEAALIGLLAHELSHPVKHRIINSEEAIDLDVIERGLGPFLAVERAVTGKYEDYRIHSGRDRYLGYRTIRTYLTDEELKQLEFLLEEMRLVPMAKDRPQLEIHELSILNSGNRTEIIADGHAFLVDFEVVKREIKAIAKGGQVCIFINGREIGEYPQTVH
jgi:hypothetical protein